MLLSSHTKYADDNILRKLKVKFFKKIVNYINGIILSKYNKWTGLVIYLVWSSFSSSSEVIVYKVLPNLRVLLSTLIKSNTSINVISKISNNSIIFSAYIELITFLLQSFSNN